GVQRQHACAFVEIPVCRLGRRPPPLAIGAPTSRTEAARVRARRCGARPGAQGVIASRPREGSSLEARLSAFLVQGRRAGGSPQGATAGAAPSPSTWRAGRAQLPTVVHLAPPPVHVSAAA